MASGGNARGWVVSGGIGAAALAAAGGFAAWQYSERPAIAQVSPAPDSAVATTSPRLAVAVDGTDTLRGLQVEVDGRDVTSSVSGGGRHLVIPTEGLKDGPHEARVRFRTGNLFARTLERRWRFEVDTTPPTLKLKAPGADDIVTTRAVKFTGTAEPGSTVSVAWKGGNRSATARPDGSFTVTAKLPEGLVATAISARDRAGNVTTADGQVVVDTIAPTLTVSSPTGGSTLTATDTPLITGSVGRDIPANLTYGVTVNGRPHTSVPGAAGVGVAAAEAGTTTVAAGGSPLALNGRDFQLNPGSLPQGANVVEVWVKDAAGNVASKKMRVFVDSTEEFGERDMVAGAKGADARSLNERLKALGLLKGKAGDRFDARTTKALKRYQKRRNVKPTGVIDQATREAMIGKIVVDLSKFRLRLYRDGKVFRTYKIAIGAPGYPTPTGTYKVVNKQRNPTWIPPNSPWAKGLGPIPPGPGNPLGTRWIGTSAPAVGIHGTYADSSIGTAASHGCMRMHIPDVEKLYEDVAVGMPVIIRQ